MKDAVVWEGNACCFLDQTRLPSETVKLVCSDYLQVVDSIKRLVVRGAPAIGVAGAYGVVLALRQSLDLPEMKRMIYFENALEAISAARPTAVNLQWAVQRMKTVWVERGRELSPHMLEVLLREAKTIHWEDVENNQRMAEMGASLIKSPCDVMTYCNAGALATGGVGTALGMIFEAHRQGMIKKVFVCETRPLLQGLRLTAWELQQKAIPYTVICDNMVATVMNSERIGAVIVGADRVAANGDVANKVGTYSVAVNARFHGVPFYVVAPVSTFDFSLASGGGIPIEQRDPAEVTCILGRNQPPYTMNIYSPAFDVTPSELIAALVCEKGIIRKPGEKVIREVVGKI